MAVLLKRVVLLLTAALFCPSICEQPSRGDCNAARRSAEELQYKPAYGDVRAGSVSQGKSCETANTVEEELNSTPNCQTRKPNTNAALCEGSGGG